MQVLPNCIYEYFTAPYLSLVEGSFIAEFVAEEPALLDLDVHVDEDGGEEGAKEHGRGLRHHALVQPKEM